MDEVIQFTFLSDMLTTKLLPCFQWNHTNFQCLRESLEMLTCDYFTSSHMFEDIYAPSTSNGIQWTNTIPNK